MNEKRTKFRITKIDKPSFFLKVGAIVYLDWVEDRIYSEDGEQYMPSDLVFKLGVDGERVEE